jgi:hypothetical protein
VKIEADHDVITGRECNRCLDGYWDFPNCKRCECNNNANTCDAITGVCIFEQYSDELYGDAIPIPEEEEYKEFLPTYVIKQRQ